MPSLCATTFTSAKRFIHVGRNRRFVASVWSLGVVLSLWSTATVMAAQMGGGALTPPDARGVLRAPFGVRSTDDLSSLSADASTCVQSASQISLSGNLLSLWLGVPQRDGDFAYCTAVPGNQWCDVYLNYKCVPTNNATPPYDVTPSPCPLWPRAGVPASGLCLNASCPFPFVEATLFNLSVRTATISDVLQAAYKSFCDLGGGDACDANRSYVYLTARCLPPQSSLTWPVFDDPAARAGTVCLLVLVAMTLLSTVHLFLLRRVIHVPETLHLPTSAEQQREAEVDRMAPVARATGDGSIVPGQHERMPLKPSSASSSFGHSPCRDASAEEEASLGLKLLHCFDLFAAVSELTTLKERRGVVSRPSAAPPTLTRDADKVDGDRVAAQDQPVVPLVFETDFLNGIRVAAMAVVVYGHCCYFPLMATDFDDDSVLKDFLASYASVVMGSGTLAVDVFFFISGFLGLHVAMLSDEKSKQRDPAVVTNAIVPGFGAMTGREELHSSTETPKGAAVGAALEEQHDASFQPLINGAINGSSPWESGTASRKLVGTGKGATRTMGHATSTSDNHAFLDPTGSLLRPQDNVVSPSRAFLRDALLAYLHRYLRLTPLVVVVYVIAVWIAPAMSTGPYALVYRSYEMFSMCDSNSLWRIALYVQSWRTDWVGCVGWFWYLSTDFQLFLTLPFLAKLSSCMAIWWPAPVLMTLFLSTSVGLALHYNPIGNEATYSKPYLRMSPYFFGALTALAIRSPNLRRWLADSWKLRWALYALSAALLTTTINLTWNFASVIYKDQVRSDALIKGTNFAYLVLWGLGLAGFTIPWCHGHGGVLAHDFLGHGVFSVLSKLTFGCYLIHPVVIMTSLADNYHILSFRQKWLYIFFGGVMLWSMVAACLLFLFIEHPAARLTKLIAPAKRKGVQSCPQTHA